MGSTRIKRRGVFVQDIWEVEHSLLYACVPTTLSHQGPPKKGGNKLKSVQLLNYTYKPIEYISPTVI